MAVRKIRDRVPYQQALLFDAPSAVLVTSCLPDRFDGAEDYDKVTKTAAICGPLFRTAWRLFSCKTEAKHTKRVLVAGFLVKARLVNSAMNQAKAKVASLAEIRKTQKT
ncbi:hypothetical protein AAK706_12520 [Erysipelotrichaceae bacterium 66-17]